LVSLRTNLGIVVKTAIRVCALDRKAVAHPTNHLLNEILPVAMKLQYESKKSESTGFLKRHFLYHVYELSKNLVLCVISGFRRDVHEICALLGYYIALSGSSVPTFRDNLSVPSLRVKKSQELLYACLTTDLVLVYGDLD
jgi:hypothetical protein